MTKNHIPIGRGVWKCKECDEKDNECKINTEETWQISLYIANYLKNHLNTFIDEGGETNINV